MRLTHFTLLISLLFAGFSFEANAGAWTQERGKGQVITTASAYRTASRFNDNGDKRKQPRYAKEELNPYLEYGLTDRLTLGGSLFLTNADDATNSRSAVGDTELFARYRVLARGRYVLSLQPMIKLPSPMGSSNDRPAIGSRTPDAGLSALAGMNYSLLGRNHYADVSAGYRYRFGQPHDQVQLAATTGLSVTDRLTIMPQLFQTIRVIGNSSAATFTQSPRDDYNLTTVQLSALYALNERDRIQVGGFRNVAGSNVGAGGGVLISYWRTF